MDTPGRGISVPIAPAALDPGSIN